MAEQNDAAPQGLRSGFPQSPSEFDDDTRISFSKLDEKYLLETDEGNEYEWDEALRRWVPVVGSSYTSIMGRQCRWRNLPPILLNEEGQILTRRLTTI